jgi:hypothetical protein
MSDPSSPAELVAYTRDFGGDVPPTVALALADLVVRYQALADDAEDALRKLEDALRKIADANGYTERASWLIGVARNALADSNWWKRP